MNDVQVRIADWQKDNADLRRIREAVFIAEQAVPPEQEWDTMMQRPFTFWRPKAAIR